MDDKQLAIDVEKIARVIDNYVAQNGIIEKTNGEMKEFFKEYNVMPESEFFQPSDFCYDKTIRADLSTFPENIHLFSFVRRGKYRLLGSKYPYTGKIRCFNGKGKEELIVGEWFCGKLISWNPDSQITKSEYDRKLFQECSEIELSVSNLQIVGLDRETIVKSRINQGEFRRRLMRRYNHCCICNVQNPDFLIASHIKPWGVAEAIERTDVNNGFLMCPAHDKAFDKGYISFDDNGSIMISKELGDVDRIFLNIDDNVSIDLSEDNRKYLKYHRENVFRSIDMG